MLVVVVVVAVVVVNEIFANNYIGSVGMRYLLTTIDIETSHKLITTTD